ncbi:hypothetical protein A0J61_08005 [Choanephora cucurbitarum]|uniref:Uncharacterized protein n=1 Tax=Choanephora cucurbitarum TaxID=101091 RepID=A0A1C7N5N5_9FUNG|nr:hypothetical protein A0J61_08005 [Choanephora cucurbitarum]
MQSKVLQQIIKQPTIARVDDLRLTNDLATIVDNFNASCVDSGIIEMSESVSVSICKHLYRLKLYYRFPALADVKEEEEF